ncbi:MAG: hypothetical protein ACOYCB_12210 [Fastidiosipilaceae bacterium]|jgi:hypothetical protein
MKRVTLGIAALTAAALTGLAADSAPLAVDSECGAPRWNRVFTQTVPLTWDWEWRWVPAEAAQVTLRIAGVNNGVAVEQTFQKPVAEYIWDVYARPADFHEDIYEATLTFSDAEGTPLASKAARLNVLAGAFTGAAVTTVATNAAGWNELSANIPVNCFGVYRNDSRKAWLVHRPSPFEDHILHPTKQRIGS